MSGPRILLATAALAGCVLLRAPACRGGVPGERSGIVRLARRCFPGYVRRSEAEFGWRVYDADLGWRKLPAALPAHNVAVLMQGLDDPGKTWMNLAPALTADGWTALELRYPNDQPILDSTTCLLDGIRQLQGLGMRSFVLVGHSMGGLISRCLLSSPAFDYRGRVAAGEFPVCRRLIQIGSPNHGSGWARLRILGEWREHAYKLAKGGSLLGGVLDGNGEAGPDLLPDSDFIRELNRHALPPEIPVTIIAGVVAPVSPEGLRNTWRLWQRRKAALPEDRAIPPDRIWDLAALLGDGVVPLHSTRIDGVRDYLIFPAGHLFLIRNISPDSRRIPPAVPIVRDRLREVFIQETADHE